MTRIAFLGTGIMGGHMARRLAEAGGNVIAWNRSPEKVDALVAGGVRRAATPTEAVRGAGVVIVMLSTGAVVDEVVFERDASGVSPAEAMSAGTLVIVTASIPVDAARRQAERLASRGVRYVDAPVSGGERGARDGALSIMAGGSEADVAAARAVLAPLGRTVHVGPVGSGQLTKLANQIVVSGTLLAVAEAFAFAHAGGADLAAVREALSGGFTDSTILRQHGERMVKGDYVPGSPAVQLMENLGNVQAQARSMGLELELAGHAESVLAAMRDAGRGALDIAAVYETVAERSRDAAAAARRGP